MRRKEELSEKVKISDTIKVKTYKVYLDDNPTSIFYIKVNELNINRKGEICLNYENLGDALYYNDTLVSSGNIKKEVKSEKIKYWELHSIEDESFDLDAMKYTTTTIRYNLFGKEKSRSSVSYYDIISGAPERRV